MREKIIQFGEGGFLRGFADWIFEITNEKTDFNGSVVVVQPIKEGLCDKLMAQGCEYTHIMRGLKDGKAVTEEKKINVISRCINPYADFKSYLSLAENPNLRFIVSNTTEAGIAFNEKDSLFDEPPSSFPGKVTILLYRRFMANLPGFIFLPCELIDKNGEKLREIILKYAELWDLGEKFKEWVLNENIFCNTLVDRIVTGYPKDEDLPLKSTDMMLDTSELFHLWVIEGPKAVLEEIPLDKTGLNIIFTDNLERYRTRKVRILNGAHTSMIPYAMLLDVKTVGDCMDDKRLSEFVRKCVYDEIIPTLDLPYDELLSYADDVFLRFKNPFIKHLCVSISLNSVSKFKVRVLPSILEYIRRFDKTPQNLVFSLARLIEFYKTGTPTDDKNVIEFIKEKSLKEILSNTDFWDTDLSFLYDEVKKAYDYK